MSRKRFFFGCFFLHILIIITISAHDTLWLIAHDLTILPRNFQAAADKAEKFTSAVLAQDLPSTDPVRRALSTYLHLAGIERGYGYFAPNVPVSFKLVLELQHPDGRVEQVIPGGSSAASTLRIASLLDEINRTRHDQLREYLIKMMARSVWREHPDVPKMRAVFGSRSLPTIEESERGIPESFELLYTYEFSRRDASTGENGP